MTKAALLIFGLAVLVAVPADVFAKENSAAATAVNEAVLRQANTIVLRQKLAAARSAEKQGDTVGAAKLYQEACNLVQEIGSGVDVEAREAVSGLTKTRLALAREAQRSGDLRGAEDQVQQVLSVAPKNPQALAFNKQNEYLLAKNKGKMPSKETLEKIPQINAQKTDAATMVQDGKLLYEMGKLDAAQVKLQQALKINPDNRAAYYYLNLIQQAKFARESSQHTVDTQKRMAEVEKRWVLPTSNASLPVPNPYATNDLVYTGPGRQAIIEKLNNIRLDHVSFDGLPLSEVLRNLSEQSKLRDPERKGVNFLINPNPDKSGQPVAAQGVGGAGAAAAYGGAYGGGGGDMGTGNYGANAYGGQAGGAAAINPATGLPMATSAGGAAGGGSEQVDVGSYIVKIPDLTDVRLADVLDAIVLVCDHPIKYSVQDFAVVFSAKGKEMPQLFSRTFKVDPNTFYSGLESVSAQSFGSTYNTGGGGAGGSSGGGGGAGNQNNSGAVVGVVNAFAGAGALRNRGGQGGGGGGGGTTGQGTTSLLESGVGGQGGVGGRAGGGANNQNTEGGLSFITRQTSAATPSELVRAFFTSLGVNLNYPPGKAVFFNDRLGKLFVKATADDLDTIERAIEALNEVAPQVHIKARFVEVSQDDSKALGFDWYLGQFNVANNGGVVGQAGSAPSLYTGNKSTTGYFPGQTAADAIAGSANDELLTSGLRNAAPAIGTVTGILTNPKFRMVIHALEQRSGYESLAEPEVTTTSGRQTQMRATQVQSIITGYNFQQGTAAQTAGTTTGQ